MVINKHLIISLFLSFCAINTYADEVRIAVAANFAGTLKKLAGIFSKETGHTLKISRGSTGKLFAQISNGAPFDIFLSADNDRARLTITRNHAVKNSLIDYARGKLALCSFGNDLSRTGEDWLKHQSWSRLAIANPETAPYGQAARQTLKHLGLWTNVNNKLVQGESIAQAFQFTATGNTSGGFIAASQVKQWPAFRNTCWPVPAEYHSPIVQSAVLLKKAANNMAAIDFMTFLKSPRTQKLIHEQGYEITTTSSLRQQATPSPHENGQK